MGYLKMLFNWFFPPNDWSLLWAVRGIWNIKDDEFGDYTESVHYSIVYSTYRDRYKLLVSGNDAFKHKLYSVVLDEYLNHYCYKYPGKCEPVKYYAS